MVYVTENGGGDTKQSVTFKLNLSTVHVSCVFGLILLLLVVCLDTN
jgi:hypothetical protein